MKRRVSNVLRFCTPSFPYLLATLHLALGRPPRPRPLSSSYSICLPCAIAVSHTLFARRRSSPLASLAKMHLPRDENASAHRGRITIRVARVNCSCLFPPRACEKGEWRRGRRCSDPTQLRLDARLPGWQGQRGTARQSDSVAMWAPHLRRQRAVRFPVLFPTHIIAACLALSLDLDSCAVDVAPASL